MNGPDHYAEAERLTQVAADGFRRLKDGLSAESIRLTSGEYANTLASVEASTHLAQVHATLALAAAQALSAITGSTAPLGHPVHQLADDDETVTALNQWHEVTR